MNVPEPVSSNDPKPASDDATELRHLDVGYGPVDGPSSDRLDFAQIFSVFARRRVLFLLVLGASLAISALITALMPTQYTATAEVIINTPDNNIPAVLEVSEQPLRDNADVDTELRVLYSSELASKIIDEKHLLDDPMFRRQPGLLGSIHDGIMAIFAGGATSGTASATQAQPPEENNRLSDIDTLRSGLTATRVGNAYALNISYEHADAAHAAMLANAYAQAYVGDQRTRNQAENDRVIEFLKRRIDQLQDQARDDFNAVQQYRISNNLIGTEDSENSGWSALVLDRDAMPAGGIPGDSFGEVRASSAVSTLRSQRATVVAEVAELRTKYGPSHPDVKAAEAKLKDIDTQILTEINHILSEHAGANRAMVTLDDLQRRAATSQAVYESYLNAYKEAVARAGIEQAHARVISEARIPSAPSQPKVALNLAFGGLLGLGLGAVLAFVAEMNFAGLTTGREVEMNLGVPYLGFVPSNKSTLPRGRSVLESVVRYRHSPIGEALFSLFTSIRFLSGQRAQVIYITSALPDEGKTTLAVSLGAAAALAGRSAVVVDCDGVRRGLLDTVPRAKTSAGFQNVLTGNMDIDGALVIDPITGCNYLPMTAELPKERVRNLERAYSDLISELRARFDTIILDAAPILTIAGAREIALNADFVVMVVRWRSTHKEVVREALKLLPRTLRASVGVALTRVNIPQQSKYSPTDYYRSKRYEPRRLPGPTA